MLLLPQADPARAWQMQAFTGKEEMFQLADNIILYSVDKTGFYSKDQIPSVKANPGIRSTRTIDVARIRYDGNWDPEPGGWRRLANVIHNTDQVDLKIDIVDRRRGGSRQEDRSFDRHGSGATQRGRSGGDQNLHRRRRDTRD